MATYWFGFTKTMLAELNAAPDEPTAATPTPVATEERVAEKV